MRTTRTAIGTPRRGRRISGWALSACLVAAVAAVAGCGGGSEEADHAVATGSTAVAATPTRGVSTPPGPTYPPITPGPPAHSDANAADVDFAAGMITHHGQAVVMADLILARTTTPQVRALAEQIKAAQGPEIATMAGWLVGWGRPVADPYAATGARDMAGMTHDMAGMTHDMAGMGHDGMMSADQMDQLASAAGAEADRAFLTLMPEHHRGAIAMATTELSRGSAPQAKALARTIIDAQTAQNEQMRGMLAALG